jgi:hypothetical protein
VIDSRTSVTDRLILGPTVVGYLDRLSDLGVSRRTVQIERYGWISMQSVSLDQAAGWPTSSTRSSTRNLQPSIVTTTAHSTGPQRPRLPELAVRPARWLADQHGRTGLENPWIRR